MYIICISGPTASGKSNLAIDIAKTFNKSKIINADSVQVYREIKILSSMPIETFGIEHLLYGFINGDEKMSVMRWAKLAQSAIRDCRNDGSVPILVGGSPMYMRLLLDGISSIPDVTEDAKTQAMSLLMESGKEGLYKAIMKVDRECCINPNNVQRLLRAYEVFLSTGRIISTFYKDRVALLDSDIKIIRILLNQDHAYLADRARRRFKIMIKDGAIEEVRALLSHGYDTKNMIFKAIGVKEISTYLSNAPEISTIGQIIDHAMRSTRTYIKHQKTWFKGRFQDFKHFNTDCNDKILQYVDTLMKN